MMMTFTIAENKGICFVVATLLSCFLSSCLAAGVPYTRNPNKLVDYSYTMMRHHRPVAATMLLKDALDKFEKSGDKKGIAETYMAYGLYHKYQFYVPTEPSLDTSANMDFSKRRLYGINIDHKKSESYYLDAAQIFEDLGSYEGLSRAYAVLATVYEVTNEKERMLKAINKSEGFYRKMKEDDPNAESLLVLKNQTFLEFLNQMKTEAMKH